MMTRTLLRALRGVAGNDRGNVATLTAFALVPLLILLAGVINFGAVWTMRNDLQSTADAAALAGASKLGNDTQVVAEANEFAENNMPATVNGDVLTDTDVEIGNWNSATRVFTVGGAPKNAVRATTRRIESRGNAVPTFLGNFIGMDHFDIAVAAIAAQHTSGEGCILALDPTRSGAFNMQGNGSLTLNGCGVMSNSTSNTGFSITGSSAASMTCALSAGGVQVQKVNGLTLTSCSSPETAVTPVADPYAGVPQPNVPSPCNANLPNGATINGGCYKGGALKNNQTLSGTIVINGGTLKINSNTTITSGNGGVTIFLTNNATVDINGTATVNLTAPTSGTYKGILFYGDPDNTFASNNPSKFNGTAGSHLTGALYFPNQAVQYLGNYTGVNGCMRIVARTIEFTGNTNMSVTCPNLPPIPFKTTLSLVD